MAKEKMSEAEKYRLERKKRIAKEKKKKNSYINQNRQKVQKIEKIVGISIGAVAVLAIVFALMNYFGVFSRLITAAKVGDKSVSAAVMDCAYADVKNQAYNQSQQYKETYGSEFYTSDTPSTDACAFDSSKTWGEYFEEQALTYVQQVYAFKDEKGNELTSDQQTEINSTLDSLASSAKKNEYSLNAYIMAVYGHGVNKGVLRDWLEDVYKAQNAQTKLSDNYKEKLTDKQIKTYFNKNKANYMTGSVEAYSISVDTSKYTEKLKNKKLTNAQIDEIIKDSVKSTTTKATALYNSISSDTSKFAKAVNAYEKANKGKSATSYTDDKLILKGKVGESMTSLSEDGRTWVASGASAGTLKLIYSKDYKNRTFQYDIILVKTAAELYSTVNVRHILIQPTDTSSTTAWKEAKEKAASIYASWKKKPTEDNFKTLATENTADTGSKENGGLYEDVYPGQMVEEFNDWCFDSSRKTGDNGVVKTSYGYHIMYFVKDNGLYWKTAVPTAMAEEFVNTTVESTLKKNKAIKSNFGWKKVKGVKDYKTAQKSTTTTKVATTAAAK